MLFMRWAYTYKSDFCESQAVRMNKSHGFLWWEQAYRLKLYVYLIGAGYVGEVPRWPHKPCTRVQVPYPLFVLSVIAIKQSNVARLFVNSPPLRRCSLTARTSVFHTEGTGSIPVICLCHTRKEKSFERLTRIAPLSLVGDIKYTMNARQ